MLNLNELKNLVIEWGRKRDFVKRENARTQMCKVIAEVGELAEALINDDVEEIIDGIGDATVTLILLADMLDLDFSDCLMQAYSEIRDRKGKVVNGSFIKEI